MAQISSNEALTGFINWLFILALSGMICVWVLVIWRRWTGQPIFPSPPLVDVGRPSWGAGTVLLVLSLYLVVSFGSQWCYLWAAGRLPRKEPSAQRDVPAPIPIAIADPTPVAEEKKTEPGPDLHPAKPAKPRDANPRDSRDSLSQTEVMFVVSMINSVLLVLIPLVVRFTSGARLPELGICLHGWMQQAVTGVAATLFVAPIIFSVQMVVLQIWPADPSTDHPLKKMLEDQFTAGVVYLAIVSAVVLAPLLEELIFRVIIQGWLSGMTTRQHEMVDRNARNAAAALLVLVDDAFADDFREPRETKVKSQIDGAAPRFSWPAIVLTSLFFGFVHLPQWPAPIALFVLSISLGTVYQRTGSLIASSFMHATFNGLSTIALIGAILMAQAKDEKKLTSKVVGERNQVVAPRRPQALDAIERR